MLCFRCEHRATYLERGFGPRHECKQTTLSKQACYMFIPCTPVITSKLNKEDKRPEHGGPMLGCRMKADRLAMTNECDLALSKTGFIHWIERKESKDKNET